MVGVSRVDVCQLLIFLLTWTLAIIYPELLRTLEVKTPKWFYFQRHVVTMFGSENS